MELPDLQPWKVLSSEYELQTPWLSVRRDSCETASGEKIDDYYIIERRGVVGVIPITPEKEVVMNYQYRHGIKEIVFESPIGLLDEGKEPIDMARIELEEESGYVADELIPLPILSTSAGTMSEYIYVFLALDVRPEGKKHDHDPREEIVNQLIPLADVKGMIREGKIATAWNVAAFYHAFDWLEQNIPGYL